ncbi:MAG: DNA repair protein RecN [Proteobacteria bacterium]|nr:DNA repair protein RecN [Pseudomonadota bacterium]
MLLSLAIRDVVLIDRLELTFQPGLSVLTGETGAGKSILLDALGLALGGRGDSSLVRQGAAQAVVTTEFDVPPNHPARAPLIDQGIDPGATLVLRRVLSADGRSRAAINDQAVSVGLLRTVGERLVELQGQFEQHGLLDAATHIELLDAFAGHPVPRAEVRRAHEVWQQAVRVLHDTQQANARAKAEEDYLRHVHAELEALAPRGGDEENELSHRRSGLQHRDKLVAAVTTVHGELAAERGAAQILATAARQLGRLAGELRDQAAPALASLDRALAEVNDALAQLAALARGEDGGAATLEQVEERLFALRAAARKHHVSVEDLPRLHQRFANQLAQLDQGETAIAEFTKVEAEAKHAYHSMAERLSAARAKAAARLDKAVMAELAPLKLEKARFHTALSRQPEEAWNADGIDRVVFEMATNPGTALAPLGKIASGGELARAMLAIKVVLAGASPVPTLVFDEVDSGIGGAVAAAVGQRLARLGKGLQVLVVTHSPQVAARGDHHWRVLKQGAGKSVVTTAEALPAAARREEIARMLSGAVVTDEARAAADRLMTANT